MVHLSETLRWFETLTVVNVLEQIKLVKNV